jgi:hypothetical protein
MMNGFLLAEKKKLANQNKKYYIKERQQQSRSKRPYRRLGYNLAIFTILGGFNNAESPIAS